MPIVIECPCGKSLRVPDTAAGKKVRCPACGEVATAPDAEPMFEVVEEPARPVPKNPRRDEEDTAPPLQLADEEPPPRAKKKKKRRRLGPSRAVDYESSSEDRAHNFKRIAFVALGALMVVGGVAAIFVGESPRRFFHGIVLVIVGVGLIAQGLSGHFEE